MAKKEQISHEIFYKRLQDLAGIKTTINETKGGDNSLSTLIDHKVANDGLVYGIVKENHNYYIKKSTNKTNPTASDFVYMDGLANIRNYQYNSLAEAEKNMNFYLKNLNEAIGNTTLINNTKLGKKSVISEGSEINHYIVTVKHDNGTQKIKTTASSEEEAKKKIMAAENCPERAIISVKEGITEAGDAKEDIDAANKELPDLDKSLEKEKAEVSAVDNSAATPPPPAVETPEGGESIVGDGAADAADSAKSETDTEIPGGDETAGDGKGVDDLAVKEIEKLIGKLGNEAGKTTLDTKTTNRLLAQVIGSFKEDITSLSPEDKRKLADKILKSSEEGEENPAEVEEGACVECNTFENYMKGRGINSMDECDEDGAADMIAGYATQHGEEQPDGEMEKIAIYVTPKIAESLKNEYGHVDYVEKMQPYLDKVNEAGGVHSYQDVQPFPSMNEIDELPAEMPDEVSNEPQAGEGDFDLTKYKHQEPSFSQDSQNLGLAGRKTVDINLSTGTVNVELSESEKKLQSYIINRVNIIRGEKKETLNESKKSNNLKKIDEMIANQWKLYENVVKENIQMLNEAEEINEIFGLSKSEQFSKLNPDDNEGVRKLFVDTFMTRLKSQGALLQAYKKMNNIELYDLLKQVNVDNGWGDGTIVRNNVSGKLSYVPKNKAGKVFQSQFKSGGTAGRMQMGGV